MCQNSCQPEGLQPESALSALLVLAIERLLPSPGALLSPILAATHRCFIMLGTLKIQRWHELAPALDVVSQVPRELLRRAADYLGTFRRQALAQVRQLDRLDEFAIECRDDLRRSSGRQQSAIPG